MKLSRLFTGFILLGCFAAAATLTANSAHAEARYQKKEIEVTAAPQTLLTAPKAPPKEKAKESGPTLTVDAFETQQRSKINQITDKQIRYMYDLVTSFPRMIRSGRTIYSDWASSSPKNSVSSLSTRVGWMRRSTRRNRPRTPHRPPGSSKSNNNMKS